MYQVAPSMSVTAHRVHCGCSRPPSNCAIMGAMSRLIEAAALRAAIVDTLYGISAYELADACEALGLIPPRPGEDPMDSKRRYVSSRLHGRSLVELVDLGERIAELYGGQRLAQVLAGVGPYGVDGDLKQSARPQGAAERSCRPARGVHWRRARSRRASVCSHQRHRLDSHAPRF